MVPPWSGVELCPNLSKALPFPLGQPQAGFYRKKCCYQHKNHESRSIYHGCSLPSIPNSSYPTECSLFLCLVSEKKTWKNKRNPYFFFPFFVFVWDRGVDKKKKSRNTTIQCIWVCCVCMHQKKRRHTRVWSCVLKLYSWNWHGTSFVCLLALIQLFGLISCSVLITSWATTMNQTTSTTFFPFPLFSELPNSCIRLD